VVTVVVELEFGLVEGEGATADGGVARRPELEGRLVGRRRGETSGRRRQMSRGATVGAEEEESGGRLKMMEVA
jgi:hypothetical protein